MSTNVLKLFLALGLAAVPTAVFADSHGCDGKCKEKKECHCKECKCEKDKECTCDKDCKGDACAEHHKK